MLGLVVGQVKRASAHLQFVRSLENQHGFLTALHEISGETPPSGPAPQKPSPTRPEDMEGHGTTVTPNEMDAVWTTTTTTDAPPSSVVTPATSGKRYSVILRTSKSLTCLLIPTGDTPKSSSRWDEIRATNARGAKPSSWDNLRQKHEKTQISDQLQPSQPPSISNDTDAERVREQARFDAILEAERKVAGG